MKDLDDDELKATRRLNGVNKEIEVGEYVRTRYGEIGIVVKTYPRLYWIKKKNPSLLEYNEIKIKSKELIDLIEVRRCNSVKRSGRIKI